MLYFIQTNLQITLCLPNENLVHTGMVQDSVQK